MVDASRTLELGKIGFQRGAAIDFFKKIGWSTGMGGGWGGWLAHRRRVGCVGTRAGAVLRAGHAGPGGEVHAVAAAPAAPQPMPATSFSSIGVGYWNLTPFPLFPPRARRSNGAAGKATRAHLPARASPAVVF
jgi:hypothetical protein